MFTGFSQQTVDFLWGVRFNNERPWFMEHKQDYQDYLLQPMKDLAATIFDGLHDAFPQEKMMIKVSRIYRDARRLHGRGPYKDYLWFSIRLGEDDWEGLPTFWFEINPDEYSYGLGLWRAVPAQMEMFRRYTDDHPEELTALVEDFNRQAVFTLEGEEYAKPKGHPSDLLKPWYQKKSINLGWSGKLDERLFSPELAEEILQGFKYLMRFYSYLIKIRSMVPVDQLQKHSKR